MGYLLQGFVLGLAYLAPIGMQNMYVINAAMRERRVRALQVALITICFDVSLALACFFGIGTLLSRLPSLKTIVLLVGSLAVFYIGFGLIRSRPQMESTAASEVPLSKVVTNCFTVTWLNPQAVIDGSLLLGGFRASLPGSSALLFISGVVMASCTWFLGLAVLVSSFRHLINQPTMRIINVACGAIIICFALRLTLSAIK